MTPAISSLFWIGLVIISYTYVGYGFVIFVLSKLKGRQARFTNVPDEALPKVTVLIAAYNEEQCIEDKIANTLNLDYPKDKLSVYFVTAWIFPFRWKS